MTYKQLKEFTDNLAAHGHDLPDIYIEKLLIEFLYENSKTPVMDTILMLNDMEKKELKNVSNEKWLGLADAVCYLSEEEFFKSHEGTHIPSLIRIIKGNFPKGLESANRSSKAGKAFFANFQKVLLKNSDEYLNGKSKDWAKRYDYYDYIKMVVEQSEKENK